MGVNEHDAMRELIALAAADALDEREQALLAEHLRHCQACIAELDEWRALGRGLRRLPTPQVTPQVFERTRQQMELQLATAKENRLNPWLFGTLVLLSWTLTAASWPVLRILTQGATSWMATDIRGIWTGLLGYMVAGWAIGGVMVIALAVKRAGTGRTA